MKWLDAKTAKFSWSLAWPISLQSVLTNSLSMIDVAMVSHLGNSAVGAVGLGNRFQFVVIVILLGIAWTVGVLSAQYYGAGKPEKIRSTICMASILANTALIPIAVLVVYFGEEIIGLGSTDQEVIELGKHYLWIVIPSLSFVAVILILENAIRGLGEVKAPMVLSVIAIAINVVLNFWLINGGFGVPAMGVVGAALATAIARFVHLALFVGMLIVKSHALCLKRSDLQHLFDMHQVRYFVNLAMPMMVSFGVWSSGTFVYQIIYGRMGTQELAVMSVLTPVEGVVLALFFGLASACSITVGQRLGANRFDEALQCARTFSLLNPLVALVIGLIILLFRDFILMPFSGLPQETLGIAGTVFVLISLTIWIKVINMTLAMGILRAGGDNKICMYVDIIGMWIISIPLTAFVAFYLKWPLLWVVFTALSEEVCKALLFVWRVRKRYWLKNLTNDTAPSVVD